MGSAALVWGSILVAASVRFTSEASIRNASDRFGSIRIRMTRG